MGNISLTFQALGVPYPEVPNWMQNAFQLNEGQLFVWSFLGIILTALDHSSIFAHTLETYENLEFLDIFKVEKDGPPRIMSVNTNWFLVQAIFELLTGINRVFVSLYAILLVSDIIESRNSRQGQTPTGSLFYGEYLILQYFLETSWLQIVIQAYRWFYAVVQMTIYTFDLEFP